MRNWSEMIGMSRWALVVNDEPTQLAFTSRILEKNGWEVVPCEDGQEALQLLLNDGPCDLLVTDLFMPMIDGWRLCSILKSPSYQRFHQVPILVCSSLAAGELALSLSRSVGADAFLSSPFTPRSLLEKVESVLTGNHALQSYQVQLVSFAGGLPAEELQNLLKPPQFVVESVPFAELLSNGPQRRVCDFTVVHGEPDEGELGRLLEKVTDFGDLHVTVLLKASCSPRESLRLLEMGVATVVKPREFAQLGEILQRLARQRSLMRVREVTETSQEKALAAAEAEEKMQRWLARSQGGGT